MRATQTIREDQLSNGVRVVTEALPERNSVSIGFWVDVGSRDESDELQGCSHLIEHILFKGTVRRSAEEISRAIEERGGYLNAFTDREFTCLTASVLAMDTGLAIDVISDILQNPLLRREDLEMEKTVVLEEINRRDDNPEDLIQDLFVESAWKGNSAAHPVLGTEETVRGLSREMLEKYFHDNYTNNRFVVSASGSVEHENFMETLKKMMKEGNKGTLPNRREPAYNNSTSFHERSLSQVQLCLSTEGTPYATFPQWHALTLMNSYLGEGASSRLFQEVREKRGLVYSIHSQNVSLKDCGLFSIFAGTSRDKVEEVLDTILRELDRIREGEIKPEELEKVKHKVEGMLTLQMESSRMRMYNLGISTLRLGRAQTLEDTTKKLNEVTLDDLSALSERIFDKRKVSITALGLSKEVAQKIETKLQ